MILLILLLSHLVVMDTRASNILFLYFPTYSHFRGSLHMARELTASGHSVFNALPTKMANDKRLHIPGVHIIEYMSLEGYDIDESTDMEIERFFETGQINFDLSLVTLFCGRVLEDDNLLQSIKLAHIDLVILDIVPIARLLTIIPYRLDIPFMFMGASFEPYASRTPFVMSTFPFLIMPWTPRMDFQTRFLNTLMVSSYWIYDPFSGSEGVEKYAPEKPYLSLEALTAKGLLWLVELEPLLHYNQALLPNVKFIGSLTSAAPKKLPEKYQRFCEEAKNGVVIVSFGSNVKKLPQHLFDRLIQAFAQTEYKFIFKCGKQEDIGSDIMLTDWMPQSDLLAHSNTKLFITHCGANGQNEAFTNGVPMIGFPMFAEQHFNAAKLAYKGFGKSLHLLTFEVEELVSSINEVIQNDSYSKNIKRIAEISKLRERSPKDEAVYWIEHVIQYGGEHLRSYCQDMPLYQYLNLDVIVLLLVIVHLFLFLTWKIFLCCIRCISRRKIKRE